jgi:predicted RNA-binding protein YlxR (DUF448 family)
MKKRRMSSSSEATMTGEPAEATMAPMRSCIVCRAERPQRELVRLRERSGVAYLEGPGAGRGAWVCVRAECLDAVDGRALSRAFKKPVAAPEAGGLRAVLARVAEQKLHALLGLARRQGALVIGQDRVAGEPTAFVVVAAEASERSRQLAGSSARVFGDSASLGKSTGLNGVNVLGIAPGSLAEQAAYWFAVWYESRLESDGRAAEK